jgi:hypothetical protein
VLLATATWALAAALGATGTLELGLRAELRGLDGGPAGAGLFEPVPLQVEPTLDLSGQLDRRLAYTVALAPRLLLLAGPTGSHGVDSSAGYYAGSASLRWLADERSTLAVTGSGARGTLVMSPLAQFTTASGSASSGGAAGGAAAPGAGLLDPAAGVRAGEYSSAALRAAVDWRATATLLLGGGVGGARSGGLSPAARTLFPPVDALVADARATLTVTPRDHLAFQGSYARTTLGSQGTVGIAGTLAQWSRSLERELGGMLGAGVDVTVQDDLPSSTGRAPGRLAPHLAASLTSAAPASGPGLGLDATLSWAPYVDQYSNAVRQRLAGSVTLDWRLGPSHRISWASYGATVLDAGGARLGVVASELGGWYRQRDLEVGFTMRGGTQQSPAPVSTIRQWSVGLVARWRSGAPE